MSPGHINPDSDKCQDLLPYEMYKYMLTKIIHVYHFKKIL